MMKVKQVIPATLVCLLILLLSGVTFLAAPAMADPISWNKTVTDLRGQLNKELTVECPPNGSLSSVWGTDTYTDDSSVCSAAVHAGLITTKDGGVAIVTIRPGQGSYVATNRNGVSSNSYGNWYGSFSIRKACQDASFVVNPANNHCYSLTNVLTWHEAQAAAKAAGGNLVTINDEAEQTWLLNTFKDRVAGGSLPSFWIGFTDVNSPNTYTWVNGEPVTFTNWNKLWGEPNKYLNVGMARYGITEHYADFCVQVGPLCPEVGVWNDRPSALTSQDYTAQYGPKLKGIIERS